MAKLGVRTIEELVGRTDLIAVRQRQVTKRAAAVDMSRILAHDDSVTQDKKHFIARDVYDFKLEKTLDEAVLLPKFASALKSGKKQTVSVDVSSTNRTFGTILGSEITRKFKNTLPDDMFTVNCKGGGGQSFGAFIPKGLTITLEGDSNELFRQGTFGRKANSIPRKGQPL